MKYLCNSQDAVDKMKRDIRYEQRWILLYKRYQQAYKCHNSEYQQENLAKTKKNFMSHLKYNHSINGNVLKTIKLITIVTGAFDVSI